MFVMILTCRAYRTKYLQNVMFEVPTKSLNTGINAAIVLYARKVWHVGANALCCNQKTISQVFGIFNIGTSIIH